MDGSGATPDGYPRQQRPSVEICTVCRRQNGQNNATSDCGTSPRRSGVLHWQ